MNEDPLDGPLFQSATALRVDNQIRASGIRNPEAPHDSGRRVEVLEDPVFLYLQDQK